MHSHFIPCWPEPEKLRALYKLLESHIIAYNNNDDDDSPLLPLRPAKPAPIAQILTLASELGVRGRTKLPPGTMLYRGLYFPADPSSVPHLRSLQADHATLCRITSFTPLMSKAMEHTKPWRKPVGCSGCPGGGHCAMLSVRIDHPEDVVFSDCTTDHPQGFYTGDSGEEVQLMPGVYPNMTLRIWKEDSWN